jgi:hypothetical protein
MAEIPWKGSVFTLGFPGAISGRLDKPVQPGQLHHLCPPLVVAEQPGDQGDADVVELAAQGAL